VSGATLRPAQSINDQHLALASCHPVKAIHDQRLARCILFEYLDSFLIAFIISSTTSMSIHNIKFMVLKLYFSRCINIEDMGNAHLNNEISTILRFHRV